MLLKIKNLEYKLKKKIILKKQNFILKQGNHLLIHGPSGCGKTTLMNLMAGLLRPSNGEIIFDQKKFSNLTNIQLDDLRLNHFGFVFQKLHLISHLNIEQNIILAQNISRPSSINELMKDLGLDSLKKQKIYNLSVGEAQRVAIARAVVNRPRIIFADEPTSALDDLNTKKVMDLIIKQTKKFDSTLIVSTHDLRIKKYFSNVLEIT